MSFTTRRGSAFYKRPLALIGATALTAGAMVPLAGAANAIEEGVENTCAGLTDDRFIDLVGYTEDTQDAINCLAAYEITQGTGTGTTYEPGRQVLRWEMALFLDRLITYVDENNDDISFPDNDDTSSFDDIASVPQEGKEAIARLADLGIAEGFSDDAYGPYNPVLRRQMASFLDRIQGEIAAQSDDAEDFTATMDEAEAIYLDVPPGHPQYEDIYSVSNAGIAEGTGADLFQPNMATTRSQMALFLTRHLDALVDQGVIDGEAVTPGNQAYTVTPDGAIEKPVSSSATTNEGAVTFTFGGVDDAVTVALLPAGNVTEDANGLVTFADADASADLADGLDSTETNAAVIEQVNGAAYTAPVNPANGNVSVVVDSEAFDEAVVVVFNDADGDGELDLDANNQPTEDFAVGGPVTWLPAEAANGTYASGDVVWVDKDTNRFVLDDGNLYRYDTNDQYSYYNGAEDTGTFFVTAADFETYLSVGDYVSSTDVTGYSRDAAVPSEFELDTDVPGTPSNVSTAVGDYDDDATTTEANDVRVSWSAPQPLDGYIAGYNVSYVDSEGTQYIAVDADETSVVVEGLTPGEYEFTVTAVSYTNDEGDSSTAEAEIVAPAPPASVAGAPTSTSAAFQDNNSNGVVDGGDVLYVTFNEVMAAPDAGDYITLADEDGTTGTITNGGNATFTLSENARTLSVALTSAPVVDLTGTEPGVNYPAQVTASDGVTDTGATNTDDEPLEWNLEGSDDVFFGDVPVEVASQQ